LMLACPLLVLLAVVRGQHEHPDWSVSMQPDTDKLRYTVYSDTFPSEPALTS
ncbi:hypothetical protein M9458_052978, partial [Cirrhinus mrigala]